jgi:hypothetical protein
MCFRVGYQFTGGIKMILTENDIEKPFYINVSLKWISNDMISELSIKKVWNDTFSADVALCWTSIYESYRNDKKL